MVYENVIFEQVWVASALAVIALAGVGIYMGSQSRSKVIVTDREKFWLRLLGGFVLAYYFLGLFFFYTFRG